LIIQRLYEALSTVRADYKVGLLVGHPLWPVRHTGFPLRFPNQRLGPQGEYQLEQVEADPASSVAHILDFDRRMQVFAGTVVTRTRPTVCA
jgi:hypothetical protein